MALWPTAAVGRAIRVGEVQSINFVAGMQMRECTRVCMCTSEKESASARRLVINNECDEYYGMCTTESDGGEGGNESKGERLR